MNGSLVRVAIAVLGAAGMTASCGGGESAGGSSVSGEKPLLELSPEDNQELCQFYERTHKHALGTQAEYCTAEALFAVESVQSCEADRDACIARDDYESEIGKDWECQSAGTGRFVRNGEPCSATVSELEDCIKEDAQEWTELTHYTCEKAEQVEYPVGLGPACQKLHEECPGVEL